MQPVHQVGSRGALSTMDEEANRPEAMALYQQSLSMPHATGNAVRAALSAGDMATARQASQMLASLRPTQSPTMRSVDEGIANQLAASHKSYLDATGARRAANQERYHQVAMSKLDGSRQTPGLYGLPGVGRGSVNGEEALYPLAGQADAYRSSVEASGLPGDQMMTGNGKAEQLRAAVTGNLQGLSAKTLGEMLAKSPGNALYSQAYRAAVQRERQEAQAKGELEHRRALEVAQAEHPVKPEKPLKPPAAKKPPGLKKWQAEDMELGKKVNELEAATRGKTPDDMVLWRNKPYTVAQLRQQLGDLQARRAGGYNGWAQARRDAGDPEFQEAPTPTAAGGVPPLLKSTVVREDQMDALRRATPAQLKRLREKAAGTGPEAAQAKEALRVHEQLRAVQ